MPQFKAPLKHLPVRTEETRKNLSQCNKSGGQDLFLGHLEYKAGVLPTLSQCLIRFMFLIVTPLIS